MIPIPLRTRLRPPARWRLALPAAAALLAGCAARPAPAPPVEPPAAFAAGSGQAEAPERWWMAFGDARADSLVARALRGSFTLESAWQRLREAQAVAERAGADRWPSLDALLSGELRDPEPADPERLRLSLAADYEIDLWGRIRARARAEGFRAEASAAELQTAALTLSAEVVGTWYGLVEARSQVRLLDEQIRTNEQVLELLRGRFGRGQIRSADILRQRQLLEATREQRIVAIARTRLLEHALAVLLGRPPSDSVAPDPTGRTELPEPPALPAAGLPAELVARRPDVRAALSLLRAADGDLAAALAERYPRLTLNASGATSGAGAGELFDSWVGVVSGALLAPLFDGGARGAEVDRTDAARARRVADYGQAILAALREVEDALVQEEQQVRRLRSVEAQLGYARQTYEQLRLECFNGLGDYLDVLTALTDEQRLRRDLLSARRQRLEFRIALYRALAGGIPLARQAATQTTSQTTASTQTPASEAR